MIVQDDYTFSLVDESDNLFLSRLVIGASFFVLLSAVTNFQFQKVWGKERELRFDSERASLDSLLALSHARDGETGNRFLRKRKYVGVLVDNLKSKGWLTMPDLDAQMEQLFQVGSSKYGQKYAVDGSHELLDNIDHDANISGDSPSQTVKLMALADVYEVLTSKRPWKKSWTHKQAIDEITKMAGNRLDPKVVDAFLEEQMAFSAIADVWQDD
jgi:response regulator RpfG family c-di-GMP phosphodiesterase